MGAGGKDRDANRNNNEVGDDKQYGLGRVIVPAPALIYFIRYHKRVILPLRNLQTHLPNRG